MFRLCLLLCFLPLSLQASICSQLYNENGVSFHYETQAGGYSLKGHQRSKLFSSESPYTFRLLGGTLSVDNNGVNSIKKGRFHFEDELIKTHSKKGCVWTHLIHVFH